MRPRKFRAAVFTIIITGLKEMKSWRHQHLWWRILHSEWDKVTEVASQPCLWSDGPFLITTQTHRAHSWLLQIRDTFLKSQLNTHARAHPAAARPRWNALWDSQLFQVQMWYILKIKWVEQVHIKAFRAYLAVCILGIGAVIGRRPATTYCSSWIKGGLF